MSINAPVILGEYTVLPSAVRTATQTLVGQTIMQPVINNGYSGGGVGAEASGIIAYLNVTVAPGVETLQLALDEQDPASGVWSNIGITLANSATGMIKLKVKDAIAAVAATTTVIQIQDKLPRSWRLRVVHSASGNWTYSLGVVLYV